MCKYCCRLQSSQEGICPHVTEIKKKSHVDLPVRPIIR